MKFNIHFFVMMISLALFSCSKRGQSQTNTIHDVLKDTQHDAWAEDQESFKLEKGKLWAHFKTEMGMNDDTLGKELPQKFSNQNFIEKVEERFVKDAPQTQCLGIVDFVETGLPIATTEIDEHTGEAKLDKLGKKVLKPLTDKKGIPLGDIFILKYRLKGDENSLITRHALITIPRIHNIFSSIEEKYDDFKNEIIKTNATPELQNLPHELLSKIVDSKIHEFKNNLFDQMRINHNKFNNIIPFYLSSKFIPTIKNQNLFQSHPLVVYYGHGDINGLNYDEIVQINDVLQLSRIIIAPAFTGQDIQPFQVGNVNFSGLKSTTAKGWYENDATEFLGLQNCVNQLAHAAKVENLDGLTLLHPDPNMLKEKIKRIILVGKEDDLIPIFNYNSPQDKMKNKWIPKSIVKGSDVGASIALLAQERDGLYKKKNLDIEHSFVSMMDLNFPYYSFFTDGLEKTLEYGVYGEINKNYFMFLPDAKYLNSMFKNYRLTTNAIEREKILDQLTEDLARSDVFFQIDNLKYSLHTPLKTDQAHNPIHATILINHNIEDTIVPFEQSRRFISLMRDKIPEVNTMLFAFQPDEKFYTKEINCQDPKRQFLIQNPNERLKAKCFSPQYVTGSEVITAHGDEAFSKSFLVNFVKNGKVNYENNNFTFTQKIKVYKADPLYRYFKNESFTHINLKEVKSTLIELQQDIEKIKVTGKNDREKQKQEIEQFKAKNDDFIKSINKMIENWKKTEESQSSSASAQPANDENHSTAKTRARPRRSAVDEEMAIVKKCINDVELFINNPPIIDDLIQSATASPLDLEYQGILLDMNNKVTFKTNLECSSQYQTPFENIASHCLFFKIDVPGTSKIFSLEKLGQIINDKIPAYLKAKNFMKTDHLAVFNSLNHMFWYINNDRFLGFSNVSDVNNKFEIPSLLNLYGDIPSGDVQILDEKSEFVRLITPKMAIVLWYLSSEAQQFDYLPVTLAGLLL